MTKKGSEDRFERLVEAADVLIIGLNRQSKITLFNRKCEEVTGYSRKEVLGKPAISLLIAKDERKAVRSRFRQLLNGHVPSISPEARWITKSGEDNKMAECTDL